MLSRRTTSDMCIVLSESSVVNDRRFIFDSSKYPLSYDLFLSISCRTPLNSVSKGVRLIAPFERY